MPQRKPYLKAKRGISETAYVRNTRAVKLLRRHSVTSYRQCVLDSYEHSNQRQGWVPWDFADVGQGRLFKSRDPYHTWEDGWDFSREERRERDCSG